MIYAINAGGDDHTDVHGIYYRKDPLTGRVGTASEYGRTLLIARSHSKDQILYQTERYHSSTFGYDIPVSQDGPYVLVLKFCEVYFDAPGQKIFNVVLNKEHGIVHDLDIYAKVGRGVALDVVVPFNVKSNKLFVNGQQSYHTGKIRLDFVKGPSDNPKVNAIVVIKGTPDMVPELPPLPIEEELPEVPSTQEEALSEPRPIRYHHATTAYGVQEGVSLLPIFVAIGAFVPVLFCLCKI